MKKLLLIVLSAILIVSCAREPFSVSGERLEMKDGSLFFSFYPTDEDASYDYILTSPSGELTWSGKTVGEGDRFISGALEITIRASYERGSYSYSIYSSNGTEVEGTVLY